MSEPVVDPSQRDRIQSALEQLPRGQREAVEYLQLHQLSVAEAAELAGVSSSALKVRAHRGYRALRELLKRERE